MYEVQRRALVSLPNNYVASLESIVHDGWKGTYRYAARLHPALGHPYTPLQVAWFHSDGAAATPYRLDRAIRSEDGTARDPEEKAAIAKLRTMSALAAPAVAELLVEGHANRKQGWIQVYRPLYTRLEPLYRRIRAITGYPA